MKFLVRPRKVTFIFLSDCANDCYKHIQGCYPKYDGPICPRF